MLWRPKELEVDVQEPFERDQLGREPHVRNMANLLENSPESIVIAVDGEWGSGKTTFLRFLEAVLRSDNHPTVMFNAWEVDFVDDPLVALLSEITEATGEQGLDEEGAQTALANARKFGGRLLRRGLPILVKVGTHGLIDLSNLDGELAGLADEAGEEASDAIQVHMERYETAKNSLQEFRGALEALVESIDEEDNLEPPLVFFVDELDRCRPDFALASLERIKHAFSVPGVSFVLGINQKQLAHSIRGAYGAAFHGRRYLDRLIDLRYGLPEPTTEAFLRNTIEASGLRAIVDRRTGGSDMIKHIRWTVKGLSPALRSIRIQQKIIAHLNLVLRATPLEENVLPIFLILLIALRHKEPAAYEEFVLGRKSAKDVWSLLEARAGELTFEGRIGEYLRACLVSSSGVDGEREERVEYLKRTLERWDEEEGLRADPERKAALRKELRLLTANTRPLSSEDLNRLANRIELARPFADIELN